MELDELDNHIELFDALLGPEASNRETRFDYQLGRDTRPDSLRPGREFHRIEITTRNSNFNPIKFSWFYHSVDDRTKYYLTSLSLRGLGLDDIDIGVLNQLDHLEYLDLQANKISKLDFNNFNPKYNLHTINVSSNSLHSIDILWSVLFPHLRYINLQDNYLKKFNWEQIKGNQELNRLVLSDNELLDLDLNQVNSLKYLNYIDLSNNGLDLLIFEGYNPLLSTLHLHNNNISQFNVVGYLPQLKFLTLYENNIQLFDLEQLDSVMPNLNRLYLWGNRIRKFNWNTRTKHKLVELIIAGNRLTDFEMGNAFPDLEVLDISYNQVSDFTIVGEYKKLKRLNLDYNPLKRKHIDIENKDMINISTLGTPSI